MEYVTCQFSLALALNSISTVSSHLVENLFQRRDSVYLCSEIKAKPHGTVVKITGGNNEKTPTPMLGECLLQVGFLSLLLPSPGWPAELRDDLILSVRLLTTRRAAVRAWFHACSRTDRVDPSRLKHFYPHLFPWQNGA